MKDPFLSRHRRPNTPKKRKLVCSLNGTFPLHPLPSGNLRYIGGKVEIVTVARNIGFSKLNSKLWDLLLVRGSIKGLSLCFSFRYQLRVEDYDTTLVLITSYEDVSCMIHEYEKLESLRKPAMLWKIYVCNDNGVIYRKVRLNNTENLANGSGVFFEGHYVFCIDSLNNYGCENRKLTGGGEFVCDKVKKLVMGFNGVGVSDDMFIKVLLKRQLLGKEKGRFGGFLCGLRLAADQPEMKLTRGKQKLSQILLPLHPVSNETTEFKFGVNSYRKNVLDYKFRNTHFQRSEDLGINHLPVSHSRPLNPRDGNLHVESNGFSDCLTNRPGPISSNGGRIQFYPRCQKHSCESSMVLIDSKSILDRENIMSFSANCDLVDICLLPLSCRNQLIGSNRVWARHYGGISNHWVRPTDFRSQRSWPYNIQNHRNCLTETRNHPNVRLDGRPLVEKIYPGLRSSSSILKQGQTMRLFYPSLLWKPWSAYHLHTLGYGLNGQAHSFDQPYENKENSTNKGGHGVPQLHMRNPKQCQFSYNVSCSGKGVQSLFPTIFPNKLLTSTRGTEPHEVLLTGSIGERNEVPRQNCPRVLCSQSNGFDFEKESQFMESMEIINISGSPDTLGFRNGIEPGCESEVSKIESIIKLLSKHLNCANAIQGGLASLVDLSLRDLSLSSSKVVEPAVHTSLTRNDVSEAWLKPQSKPVDLMVEELLSSGPQVEISDGVSWDSSFHTTAKMEKVDEQKEDMQQDHPSNLSIDKKVDIRESCKCSKGNGSIPIDLATFYSHLGTGVLQTIKNSDLEYIKELGSGTYATVFHGKWHGCDVAIKKLKPSCFTEGTPDQDRLVEDFWKEAGMLGLLHHPHILAIYGVVADGPVTNLAAVTEYMVNGSLKQVLRRKDRTIDRRKRLIIAMDAAFGMEYLHEKNIVHFDLKSHNFLVNMRDPQRPLCKIGDFGLSKIKKSALVSGGVRGTLPWMAPELLSSVKNMVTEKVDVYSFGIVMWELLTGEEPYGNMRSEEMIAGIIKGHLRPEIPSWCDPVWRSLMERCWSSDPDSRPAFSEIVKELCAMSAAMNIKQSQFCIVSSPFGV